MSNLNLQKNRYVQTFEADKSERRFKVLLIDKDEECDKYYMCNHKVYFLIGYLAESKRLQPCTCDIRFQVYDYHYDCIYFDTWAPAAFRNVLNDVRLFSLDSSDIDNEWLPNLWVLYQDTPQSAVE